MAYSLNDVDLFEHLPIYQDFCRAFLEIIEPPTIGVSPITFEKYTLDNGEVVEAMTTDNELDFEVFNYDDFIHITNTELKNRFKYEGSLGVKSASAYIPNIYVKIPGDAIIIADYYTNPYPVLPKFMRDGYSFFDSVSNHYNVDSLEIKSFSGKDFRFITAQITFESDLLWSNSDLAEILRSKIDLLVAKGWIVRKSPLSNAEARK